MSLTIISDVHGKYDKYLKIIQNHPYTLQIGDLGFNYDIFNQLDPSIKENHKFIPGNHDNYDKCLDNSHCLGNYGLVTHGDIDFFFIRGADSIDKKWRIPRFDWWENEELTASQMDSAFIEYCDIKPNIMITHAAPRVIADLIGNKDTLKFFGQNENYYPRTDFLLQKCFEIHKPKLWIHGHWHKSYIKNIDGTNFVGLNELETFIIDDHD